MYQAKNSKHYRKLQPINFPLDIKDIHSNFFPYLLFDEYYRLFHVTICGVIPYS